MSIPRKPLTPEERERFARILRGDEPLADPIPTKALKAEQLEAMERIVGSDKPIHERIAEFGELLAAHVKDIADEYERKREPNPSQSIESETGSDPTAAAQWERQHANVTVH